MQAQGRALPSAVQQADSARLNDFAGASVKVSDKTELHVGNGVRRAADLSDAQREVEILHAQRDVYRCEREWMEHGDFTARGALSAARLRLLALQSERGPA